MYLTYDDYEELGGTLDETTFEEYCFEAQTLIDWYTFNRLQNETKLPEAVKRCMVQLIKLAKLKADSLSLGISAQGGSSSSGVAGAITSQSNDGVSIGYNALSASEAFKLISDGSRGNITESTIKRYLQGVTNSLGQKVLYRGLYPNE